MTTKVMVRCLRDSQPCITVGLVVLGSVMGALDHMAISPAIRKTPDKSMP
jgi:hypothetical protein